MIDTVMTHDACSSIICFGELVVFMRMLSLCNLNLYTAPATAVMLVRVAFGCCIWIAKSFHSLLFHIL